jgi:hypothetical protein
VSGDAGVTQGTPAPDRPALQFAVTLHYFRRDIISVFVLAALTPSYLFLALVIGQLIS